MFFAAIYQWVTDREKIYRDFTENWKNLHIFFWIPNYNFFAASSLMLNLDSSVMRISNMLTLILPSLCLSSCSSNCSGCCSSYCTFQCAMFSPLVHVRERNARDEYLKIISAHYIVAKRKQSNYCMKMDSVFLFPRFCMLCWAWDVLKSAHLETENYWLLIYALQVTRTFHWKL